MKHIMIISHDLSIQYIAENIVQRREHKHDNKTYTRL